MSADFTRTCSMYTHFGPSRSMPPPAGDWLLLRSPRSKRCLSPFPQARDRSELVYRQTAAVDGPDAVDRVHGVVLLDACRSWRTIRHRAQAPSGDQTEYRATLSCRRAAL